MALTTIKNYCKHCIVMWYSSKIKAIQLTKSSYNWLRCFGMQRKIHQ